MCDFEPVRPSRREVLVGGAAAATAMVLRPVRASAAGVEVMPGLTIRPRTEWGADLPPKGPLTVERPQFMLVHHTASSNSYGDARSVIRSTYAFQTSAAKRWPDVCYNFFVGRDGDVWEGRDGSLTRPVTADATGGSQGFAQLICLLGDFTSRPPSVAARASLAKVIAWLAGRDGIDIGPSATTTFISRGSQRWPSGQSVTTATVAGHRDMSYTACPGDSFYPALDAVRADARAQFTAWAQVTRPAVRLGVVAP
jgi:hypothetical protein